MKTVLCGGCFNKIHEGHVYFLNEAKKLGNFLVVVVANDRLNKKKYGARALPAKKRKANIEKLGIADKVVIGREKHFGKALEDYKPDVIALGFDQSMPVKTKIKVTRIRKLEK